MGSPPYQCVSCECIFDTEGWRLIPGGVAKCEVCIGVNRQAVGASVIPPVDLRGMCASTTTWATRRASNQPDQGVPEPNPENSSSSQGPAPNMCASATSRTCSAVRFGSMTRCQRCGRPHEIPESREEAQEAQVLIQPESEPMRGEVAEVQVKYQCTGCLATFEGEDWRTTGTGRVALCGGCSAQQ